MRLASAPHIALAVLGWACATEHRGSGRTPANDQPPAKISNEPADLSSESGLVDEAKAALEAGDFAAARGKASEAITALRARSHTESAAASDEGWLELLHAAGEVAWTAEDPQAARTAWQKVLEVRSLTLPEDHIELQNARRELSNALYALGDLAAAFALDEKVLEVCSRTLPEDHPDLQRARMNFAVSIKARGDLQGARELEEKVLDVFTRTLPGEDPRLPTVRLGLGATLRSLGDLQGARANFEQALDVFSRTLPDDHPHLRAAREGLAATLHSLEDFEGARPLFEKVLEVSARTLPEDHPDLQLSRLNLAITMRKLGDLQGARALEETVLESISRSLPEDHPQLQYARANLANTLSALGDLRGARALQETILEVFSRTLPEDHPDLQVARLNLALTIAGEIAAGTSVDGTHAEDFARLTAAFLRTIARSGRLAVLTESAREAEERCANLQGDLGLALSFAEGFGVLEKDVELEREAFVVSEETRGAALASARLARRANSDPRHAELRSRMSSASEDLARLAQGGAGADELDAARTRRERAERELVGLAQALSGGKELLELDLAALSAGLSGREALVGFHRYTRWVQKPRGEFGQKATESLCAFLLRPGDRLVRVELGPIDAIEGTVGSLRQGLGVGPGRGIGAGAGGIGNDAAVLSAGEKLRRLIFDPLIPAMDGVDRLVVALDDVLHLVPLDALPLPTSVTGGPELLGDRWRIETRCTLSELRWEGTSLATGEVLLAVGGASFDLPALGSSNAQTTDGERERPVSMAVASVLRGGAWEGGFEPLEHTGPEARGIAALHDRAFEDHPAAVVLVGREASRAALAELAPGARFLHIATHGWFAPESVRSLSDPGPLDMQLGFGVRTSSEERVRGMSPMLLSGLALAGANLPQRPPIQASGLLTAEELSTIDLSGCELAVLSACDTNVGERRAGQGVASLQKALHMAGARSVITSLWKVPDEATRELMLDFYRRIWIEKKPKGQALWEAKMKIRNTKDEKGRPLYTTRDWAAWVLTGEQK